MTYLSMPHPSGLAVDRSPRPRVHRQHAQPEPGLHLRSRVRPSRATGSAGSRARRQAAGAASRSQFLPGRSVPARSRADRRRPARQRRRRERGRRPARRRTCRARLVAAGDRDGCGPVFSRNHLQLNSIAAGRDLGASYFSASAATIGPRRPGHRNFPVDGRGVIFSGATREPVATGLTRPHSARLHGSQLWVDNSGYGEVGLVEDGRFRPVARLAGLDTRVCASHGDLMFVGTSRVIPRFRSYAPGLDVDGSVCGVHAVDARSGVLLGSLVWPEGNQVFAVEAWMPRSPGGFPKRSATRASCGVAEQLFVRVRIRAGRRPKLMNPIPPPDDRRDVRERREHHAPLPRRPPAAATSTRSSRRSARGTSPTASVRCSRSKYRWPVFAAGCDA